MFPKKRISNSKNLAKSNIKNRDLNKSISLILNNNNLLSTDNFSKKLNSNLAKKSNSVDKSVQKNHKLNKNDKNKNSSKLFNLNFYRQNSQGALYTQKTFINDAQLTNINLKYQKLNSHLLNETKTPKIIELLNNKIKKKKNYLETYENNLNKSNDYSNSKTPLSIEHKKKNLSQGNLDHHINFDEFYNYNIYKSSRNSKVTKKEIKHHNSQDYKNHKIYKNQIDRYDKNKCVIERKLYKGDKNNQKNDKNKKVNNKNKSNNCDIIYNNILINNIKLNINKEMNSNLIKSQKYINLNKNNINSTNSNIYKNSSYKFLPKSNSNINILSTSFEDLIKNNKEDNNNNSRNKKEIKLIFPSFTNNKLDINNDSLQESTSQIGSLSSNKYTINNSNLNYKKEKFISSFIDGPEDIHCKFVELHRQKKMFYENLYNKLEEGNSIDINKANMTEFDKNENSEYFDNYNEDVPLI